MSVIQKNLLYCLMVFGLWNGVETNVRSQSFDFSTLAGNAGYGSVDGQTNQARFDFPQGVAVDPAGIIYVADTENCTIRRVDPSGWVDTLAGLAGNAGGADGAGPDARFSFPGGIAADNAGNVYVADTGNSIIRKVDSSGMVSTLAGSRGLAGGADGTNGVGRFSLPDDVTVDGAGILYVADTYNHTIRMINPMGTNWIVTTLAGSPGVSGNSDGTNSIARFYQPSGITVDMNRNLYVADTGNGAIRKISPVGTNWVTSTLARLSFPRRLAIIGGVLYVADSVGDTIRKVTPSGTNWVVSVLAGSPGVPGSADGTNAARFNSPGGIAAAAGGSLCVADSLNNTIRKVTLAGVVSTLAGMAGGAGRLDGARDQARFNAPLGLTIDAQTNIYVADSENNTIRLITPAGLVTTLAGVATNLPGSVDGSGTNASFNLPAALALDQNGNVYVADQDNNEIRKLKPNGDHWTVTTLAGRAGAIYLGNITNYVGTITNVVGGITRAGIAFSSTPVFVNYSGVITNISGKTTNVFIIVASSPIYTNVFKGKTNLVTLSVNSFTLPQYSTATIYSGTALYQNYGGVITNISGGVIGLTIVITNTPFLTNVVDGKIQTNWLTVNNFVLPPAPPLLNGVGTNALFHHPSGLALDGAGNLYVADGGTNGVRLIVADGTVTTLAGSYGAYSVSAVQFGTSTLFYHSSAVAIDGAGNVYVADAGNNTIRKIVPGMPAATIAGSPGLYGVTDGTNADARFAAPFSLALDAQTNLFVADSVSHTIRKILRVGSDWVVTTVGGLADMPGCADGLGDMARFNGPGAVAVDAAGNLYVADTGNNTIRLGSPVLVAPVLQISLSASQVIIAWPAVAAAAGFVLETTTTPASGGWTTVANPPIPAAGQLVVTNDIAARPAAFYRLRKP